MTPLSPRPRPLSDSVLQLMWHERRISRAEIARRAELSRSTVSEIVGSLLDTGLIAEVGAGPSRGGRRPILLEFQDDAAVILGVEVGAAHVAVVLTNLRGEVRAFQERSHPVRRDPQGTRALVTELCDRCLDAVDDARDVLVGIGIGMPCPIDPDDPETLSEVVMPDWGGRSGFGGLVDRYGVPVLIDNDANLGAVAERWWGAGRGFDDFAYIKVATGIGSGHVIGGQIYRGATGVAGEIGHMAIDPKGGRCVCGLRGCLTTFVGQEALHEKARQLLAEYPESRLREAEITTHALEEAALEGDELALRLVREAAQSLGVAVASLLNLMNPQRVIIGGDLARVGDLLLDPLRETVSKRTLVSSVAAADVVASELGPRSVAVGAATLILEAALEDSSLFPQTLQRQRSGNQ